MKRGVALPLALFALALASSISVGGLYVARQLAKSTHSSQRGGELEPVSEALLVKAVAHWDSAARTMQGIGTTAQLTPDDTEHARVSGWVTRLSQEAYWMVAEAETAAKPLLRRRLGLVIRTEKGRPRIISPRAWAQLP
jgi:hypothetical protein